MKISDVLKLTVMQHAKIVAGSGGVERDVRWVHIVDLPDILPWVRSGQLLLTTGYAWPRDENSQRLFVRTLAERNLAGVALAVPHFFDHFSTAAREEADAVQLPLLEIPWDMPFAQITEELHRTIIAEQYHVIEQAEAMHRTLTRAALEANSLQDLTTTFGRLIQRAVTLEDADGLMLACYTVEQEEDSVRRATNATGQSPREIIAQLESRGYMKDIRKTQTPLHIPAILEYEMAARVVCPIRLKEELIGFVWIIEGDHPLSELDLRTAENAAIIAALQIAHQRKLASLEAQLGYTFLDSLLEGRFEPTLHALERAKLLGFDPEGQYRVGLLVLDEAVPLSREGFQKRERLAERLRQRLRFLDISPLISVSLNQIPFLLPHNCDGERIWNTFSSENVSLAFGQVYKGVEGVMRSYREVSALLPYLPPNSFHYYETLLLPRVLMGDNEAQHMFLDTLLGRLKQQRNGEILIETVLTWAQAGFHFPSVAQRLNIHPKTLQYRLARAADLAQIDLADTDIRFRLQLAAHLLSLPDRRKPLL